LRRSECARTHILLRGEKRERSHPMGGSERIATRKRCGSGLLLRLKLPARGEIGRWWEKGRERVPIRVALVAFGTG
jgi:hypothetical protein